MPDPILTTVTVDTEEEWDWAAGYPTGPTRVSNIQHLPGFQDRCERHGAAVTYFVNHAVLAAPDARRVVLDLAKRPKVEIGLHIHPWNTPPLQPVDAVPVRDSFLHNLPPDLALAKLRTVLDAFREHGLKPTSYRGGRYSTTPEIQNFLRDNGFVADCSVLPYTTWADEKAPDYRHRDPFPVRLPPRRPGDSALWELPLTLGFTRRPFGFWRRFLAAAKETPLRHLRLVGLLDRLGIVRTSWLNFENPLGERMLDFLRVVRAARLPAVCFTLHSSSLLPGGSPYSRSAADVDRLFAKADAALAAVAADPEFRPATSSDVARTLETRHHARDRHQPAG